MKKKVDTVIPGFPKFSESKGILKIGRSEVCVSGGSSRVNLLNQDFLYIYILAALPLLVKHRVAIYKGIYIQ